MKITAKTHRRLIVAGTLLAVATPSFAIFGLGDIVFDPTNYAELISQGSTALHELDKLESQLATMEKQYQTAQSTYNTIQANVRMFTGKNAWRTIVAKLTHLPVKNSYGETAGWDDAMNNDDASGATSAWMNATVGVNAGATASLKGQTAGTSAQLASLALIEASDSISPTCMNAVAQYRSGRADNATAEFALEDDQFDESDDTNSEIEQLNLLNGSQSQHMHELQLQGVIQTCIASQATVANMQQRNAAAQDLNTWGFVKQQQTTNPTFAGGSSGTWTTYLP